MLVQPRARTPVASTVPPPLGCCSWSPGRTFDWQPRRCPTGPPSLTSEQPLTMAYAWRDCGLVFSPLRCTLAPCSSTSDPALTSTGTARGAPETGGTVTSRQRGLAGSEVPLWSVRRPIRALCSSVEPPHRVERRPLTKLRVLKAGRVCVKRDRAIRGAQEAAMHSLMVRACADGSESTRKSGG